MVSVGGFHKRSMKNIFYTISSNSNHRKVLRNGMKHIKASVVLVDDFHYNYYLANGTTYYQKLFSLYGATTLINKSPKVSDLKGVAFHVS